MAYLFDFNRFDYNLTPAGLDALGFDFELSVSTDTPHQSSCCCEACETEDLDPSDIDYTNYGMRGF